MNIDFLKKQCYRIAFIGRTSSGKTCILASLRMGRSANVRLTSPYCPQNFPKLTEKEIERLDTDKQIRMRWNFQIGDEQLNGAIKNWEDGKRPAFTERTADVRPMMEFKLGDSQGRGDFFIWTEDYPGEMLNVEDLKEKDSEAHVLMQRLVQYDGLIWVVDTAVTEEQKKSVAEDIDDLSGFFACLAEYMKSGKTTLSQIPFAIVLSKWDRYSKSIQFKSPETERKKLEDYLKENPMYNSLIKAIRSYAQQQEAEPTGDLMAGIAYGNTAVFPVSAFGSSVDDSEGFECPDKSSRISFGIVEPFFWLACRSDDLNIDRLEKKYDSVWKWHCGKVDKIRTDAERFSSRINGATDAKKRFTALIKKCNAVSGRLTFFWVCAILFLALFVYDECCSYKVSRWESVIGSPSTTLEQLTDLSKQLDSYKALFYKGLFFAPSAKRIDGDIKSVTGRIDGLLWEPVKNAKELSKQSEFSQRYIKLLPTGPHSKDAWKFINDHKASVEEESWNTVKATADLADRAKLAEQYLKEYNEDGNAKHAVDAKNIIEQYKTSIEEKVWKMVEDAIPNSEYQRQLAQEYINQYPNGKHQKEADRKIKEIDVNREWDKALADYNGVKNNGSISQTLKELQDLMSRFGITKERCLPLITEIPEVIKSKLNSMSASMPSELDRIVKCDDARTALKSFESALRGKNENSLANSIVNARQFVEEFRTEQINMYDRKLYENVRKSKTADKCEIYQNSMKTFGGGAMASYVSQYSEFLESKNKIQDSVEVVGCLYWGPQTYSNVKIKFEMHIGNKDVTSDIRSYSADVQERGRVTLKDINPNDKIHITVSSKTRGNWMYRDDLEFGGGEDSFYLSELIGSTGRSINLRDDYNGKFSARLDVTASAPGIKTEPELPIWIKK